MVFVQYLYTEGTLPCSACFQNQLPLGRGGPTLVGGTVDVLWADAEDVGERAAGVAKIRTKRKGGRGEILIVTTDAPDGRDLIETWELHADPRVLVVRTEVEGRRSFTFKRVYEPEKPAGEAPTPAAPVPSSTPSNSA